MKKQTKNSINNGINASNQALNNYTIVKTKAINEIISLLSRVNSDFVYIAQDNLIVIERLINNLIDIKNNEVIKWVLLFQKLVLMIF